MRFITSTSSSSFKHPSSSALLLLLLRRLHHSPPSPSFAVPSAIPSAEPPPPFAGGGDLPSHFDHRAVLDAISSYTNDWSRAVDFFRWIKSQGFRHDLQTYNRLIDVLGKFFEFDLAWNLLAEMRSNPSTSPDHSTFRILFKRYAAAHLVQEAIAAFERSSEFGLRDQICFHHLIDALCEYRHVIEVEDLFLKKDPPPFPADTKLYNMVLRGWYKMGWWSRFREFWLEMDRKGIKKDLHSYSIYMDVSSKSGKPYRAVKLYKEMKRKKIPLDIVAYNIVLMAIGKLNGADESIRLYREMMEIGCRPNLISFNTLIKLLCGEGRIREAHSFFDRMRRSGFEPNVISYHCLFRSMSKPGEILELFGRMMESGCRPSMETYVMLMRKFGRWGFLRPVFFVWRTMEEQGCSPDGFAYEAMIEALMQKGMVELAREYDSEMLAKGLSAKPRKEFRPRFCQDQAQEGHID